ncbi:MAG: DUF5063 domain-containing protein [Acidobacteriota bacterium]
MKNDGWCSLDDGFGPDEKLNARADFAAVVREFCAWADSAPGAPKAEADMALRLLLRLHLLALDLRDVDADERAPEPELTHDDWKAAHARFGSLPFQYYATLHDPHEDITGTDVQLGDIADDLADIYIDLAGGLSLEDAGHSNAAEWHWRYLFWHHWGRHASAAIRALQVWIEREAEWLSTSPPSR